MPRITTPADVTEFRNRLCEVAAQLFAEKGYEGFNMRELAGRLGISTMTPYRYFKDKEAILSEVRARAFLASQTGWKSICPRPTSTTIHCPMPMPNMPFSNRANTG